MNGTVGIKNGIPRIMNGIHRIGNGINRVQELYTPEIKVIIAVHFLSLPVGSMNDNWLQQQHYNGARKIQVIYVVYLQKRSHEK